MKDEPYPTGGDIQYHGRITYSFCIIYYPDFLYPDQPNMGYREKKTYGIHIILYLAPPSYPALIYGKQTGFLQKAKLSLVNKQGKMWKLNLISIHSFLYSEGIHYPISAKCYEKLVMA